ncbi:hypothetical protein MTE2_4564 [Klebsiella pneumoniae VA360]|nr:hypothetical protein MTE2_4564 [Klebsiella pneumoniae VA360]
MGVVCQSPTLCYKLFLYKLCDRYKAYFFNQLSLSTHLPQPSHHASVRAGPSRLLDGKG